MRDDGWELFADEGEIDPRVLVERSKAQVANYNSQRRPRMKSLFVDSDEEEEEVAVPRRLADPGGEDARAALLRRVSDGHDVYGMSEVMVPARRGECERGMRMMTRGGASSSSSWGGASSSSGVVWVLKMGKAKMAYKKNNE